MSLNRQGAMLNAFMLAGLVAVVAGPIRRFVPEWQPIYIVGAAFLVALQASLLHFAFRREQMWFSEWLHYSVPELTMTLVIMRVAATLSMGLATLQADARRWLYDPFSIFDTVFVSTILLGLIIAILTHTMMQSLFELAPRSFETALDSDVRGTVILAEERGAALQRVSKRFVFGGVILLLSLGMETVDITRLTRAGLPISRLSMAGALSFVVSGLLLYSQARLALLQSRWRLDGAQVAADIPRRWSRTSALIIGGIVAVALLLPRTYGMGLLDTIAAVFGFIGYALAIAGYLIIWLFSLLLLIPAWILSWLTGPGESVSAPPMAPPQLPEAPPSVVHQPQLPAALLFWGCMLLLVGYASWIVIQRNPWLLQFLTRRGPLAWLARWLGVFWRDTRNWTNQAIHVVQQRLSRPPRSQEARVPWLRLSKLAPRELIRYFYRSTLRRAGERGLPRRHGQTPYEYSATLAQRLPDAQEDIAALTNAFVEAQYSPQDLDQATAQRARKPWTRLRRHLRSLLEKS